MRSLSRFVARCVLLAVLAAASFDTAAAATIGIRESRVTAAAQPSATTSNPVVFSTDFESGLPPEMTAPGSVLTGVQGYAGLGPAGNQFGGQFLRYTSVPLFDTKLVLRGLPSHTHVSLGFLLAVIDSWDGTEVFKVSVDGVTLFANWFQLALGDASSYVAPPGALLSSGTNLGFTGGTYYTHDRAYDLSVEPAFVNIAHTSDSLTVVWNLGAVSGGAAEQWQGGGDESWAIDNVSVSVTPSGADVPPGASAPRLELAGLRPNPSRASALRVQFTLPTNEPAQLELYDLSGRRLRTQDVGALGAGTHVVNLSAGSRIAPGLYLVRLTQGSASRTSRAVVVE
jgi:hypothetical protein